MRLDAKKKIITTCSLLVGYKTTEEGTIKYEALWPWAYINRFNRSAFRASYLCGDRWTMHSPSMSIEKALT